ncbi:MAG: outer membrane lipoprotein carrier protein LolA [Bacteroidales bacterium]
MKRLLSIITLIAASISLFAQNDPAAVRILDNFSAKATKAPSVSMKFTLETIDQVEGTSDNITGSAILSRDRYRIELPENIIWYNGETSWSYLADVEEVTITKPEKDDESFMARPSAIFSVYKKDYKARLLEDRTASYLIDLYPDDINSDHVRIRLQIGKPGLDLKSLEYKYKNGITIMLKVSGYDLTLQPADSEFVFSQAKYKEAEIIDMR